MATTERRTRRVCYHRVGLEDLEDFMDIPGTEVVDSREGSQLDYILLRHPGGYTAWYEEYLNEWSSAYYVEKEFGDAPYLLAEWEKFVASYDAHYGREEE